MKNFFSVLLVLAVIAGAADFEYSSGGAMGTVPTDGGDPEGWGDWFVLPIHNDSGHDIVLAELGFPCCGPPTCDDGWLVWTDVGGLNAPAGDASTADYSAAFTPVDPAYGTYPPIVYTYIDVTSENIVIPDGVYFCIGYDVTGYGGQIYFNGVNTWAWWEGEWDGDEAWDTTAVLEVSANYDTALERNTWGSIKTTF